MPKIPNEKTIIWKYPILCLTVRGGIFVQNSDIEWLISDFYTVKSGFYSNMEVIDSDMSGWRVIDVEVLFPRKNEFDWALPFFRRKIPIHILADHMGVLSLDYIKEAVCRNIDIAKDVWESGRDTDSWKNEILNKSQFRDIVIEFI